MRLPYYFNAMLLLACMTIPVNAAAISLIRDAEIENTLRAYGNPIFEKAGLDPEAVHIFIVEDDTINAYVAGGQNMFIHTGLILKTQDALMLIGVMAHETGHMAGGHLAQGTEKLKNAQMGAILAAVLGAAVAAGGGGDAGIGIIAAGQEAALRNYLHFSRSNENAADQAALDYLDSLHISASGFLRMMELLRQNENRSYGSPDPYTRTHPLNIDRITHVRNHVMQFPVTDAKDISALEERHKRMIAKLYGFTRPTDETLLKYPLSDNAIDAHYARAIAYYRKPLLSKALEEINSLIATKPADPFFHELRGQVLFENGHIAEALQSYAKAVYYLPDSALILTDYSKVLIATENAENIKKAIATLNRANAIDNTNPETWHHLAIAYGKIGNQGMFYLTSAEEAALEDNITEVLRNTNEALKTIIDNNAARLRATDLKMITEKEKEEKKDEKNKQ